jgi:hypothetical protein
VVQRKEQVVARACGRDIQQAITLGLQVECLLCDELVNRPKGEVAATTRSD